MSLAFLSLLVFVSTLGLCLSALYFLIEAPAARRHLRARLAVVEQPHAGSAQGGAFRLREQVLSEIPILHRLLVHVPVAFRLQALLQQAAVDITVGMLLTASLSLGLFGFVAALLFRVAPLPALGLASVVGAVPIAVITDKRRRRLARFEEQFPDAIDLLGRAVRAGHAFTTGFELIAREMPEPLASEFGITFDQQNLGLPLRDALDQLARRVPLPDVRFFVTALQIQRDTGGNLAEILEKLSYVIRERFKLFRQVRVYTAEGRMSLFILTAVPPVTAFLLYLVNRDYILPLFVDPTGQTIAWTAAALQVLGFLWIRDITSLRV